jgi:hypothetical protein
VRYDVFDPDSDDRARILGDGEQRTFGVLVSARASDALSFSLLWEHQLVDTFDRAASRVDRLIHDPITFQTQMVF